VNKFNLVGEGIFMFSACMVTLVSLRLGDTGIRRIVFIIIMLAVGAIVGMGISFVPAYLDAKLNINVVVISLMLNSILVLLSEWVLRNHMRDTTIASLGSLPIPDEARIGSGFGGLRISLGVFFAIICVVIVSVLFYKMVFGYKMRVVGSNPDFARSSGISMIGTIVLAQVIGGALAGIGGTVELLGNYDRYRWVTSTQHGFDGLMVAVLARRNPILVPVAAFLLAYIRIGADVVNSRGDIPLEFITVIQGVVILLIAAEEFMGRYKKKLIYKASEEALKREKAEVTAEILTDNCIGKGV